MGASMINPTAVAALDRGDQAFGFVQPDGFFRELRVVDDVGELHGFLRFLRARADYSSPKGRSASVKAGHMIYVGTSDGLNSLNSIQTAMAIIIRFSVRDTKPKGTFEFPPTQAHLRLRLSI